MRPAAGMMEDSGAISYCSAQQARVCTHTDMMTACGAVNPFDGATTGWYGDHGVVAGGDWDDEYGTWNRNYCAANNDGAAVHAWPYGVNEYAYKCCKGIQPFVDGALVTVAQPSGWTCTDSGDLCVENQLQEAGGMHSAIPNCQAKQARVCTHVDMMTACGISGFNPFAGASTGWYGDHGVAADGNWDDEFGTWNRNFCDVNNDGPAHHSHPTEHAGNAYAFRCCKGAPRSCPSTSSSSSTGTSSGGNNNEPGPQPAHASGSTITISACTI